MNSPTNSENSIDPSGSLPKPRILDYPSTLLFALWFAMVLCLYELIQRAAILVSPRLHELSIVGLNRSILFALKLAGVSFDIEHRYRPPAGTPLIIVSDHQSLFDIPLLHQTFLEHHPRYIAKKELVAKYLPSVTFNLTHGNNCIIDRSDPRQALPAIKQMAEWINQNKRAVVIFPEGTRGRDGRLKPFKTAGISALLRGAPDAQIIPVTIDNSWIVVARKLGPIPRGTTIKVIVDSPIDRVNFEKPEQLAEEARRLIRDNLSALRGVPADQIDAPPRPAEAPPNAVNGEA